MSESQQTFGETWRVRNEPWIIYRPRLSECIYTLFDFLSSKIFDWAKNVFHHFMQNGFFYVFRGWILKNSSKMGKNELNSFLIGCLGCFKFELIYEDELF